MSGVVIAGAGECGARAAFSLRDRGYDGRIILIGAERHLPYERPPLSKGSIAEAKPVAERDAYAAARIDLELGANVTAVARADKRVHCDDGRSFGYDKLLLATGARARLPQSMDGHHTLRTFDDAQSIFTGLDAGMRLVIIGGGFIGLECASVARQAGATVTVIEAGKQVMNRIVPDAIAAIAAARHQAEGVRIVLGESVASVDPAGVALGDGTRLDADRIVIGVGSIPNTELAEFCGLTVDDGIVVDDRLRTSDPDIHAAGDCCRFPYRGRMVRLESWRAAHDQAVHAAGAILGDTAAYAKTPWFWSDQYDLSLQVAGLPDPDREFARRDLDDGAFLLFQTGSDGALAFAAGIGRGNAVAKDIRLSEMIIERGVPVAADQLADRGINLKSILRGS